jgi:hypothetical protein
MTILEALWSYFQQCELLEEGVLHVNYLGSNRIEYTLDETPAEPIVKTYVDGSTIRQKVFVFASREYYEPDALVNIASSGFYERLINWIEEQNEEGNLPELPGVLSSQKLEILSQQYLFQAEEDRARLQIQARLLYYKP